MTFYVPLIILQFKHVNLRQILIGTLQAKCQDEKLQAAQRGVKVRGGFDVQFFGKVILAYESGAWVTV